MTLQPPFLPREEAIAAIKRSKIMHDQFDTLKDLGTPGETSKSGLSVEFTGHMGPQMKEALQRIAKGDLTTAERGDLALRQGKYVEAVNHYEAVTIPGAPRNPYSLACYGNHCQALMYLKRWGEASELYDVSVFHFVELHGGQTNSPVLQALHLKGGVIHKNLGYYERAQRLLKTAVSIDPSNEPAQAELKYVEGVLRNNNEKYKNDRRAELEGRTKENANYGLNREEIELLWECGVMPWDDYVDDYLDAARGLKDDGEDEEDDGRDESSTADLARMISALRMDQPGSSSDTIQDGASPSQSQKTGPKPRHRKKADKSSGSSQPQPTNPPGPQTRHDLTQCQQCWASKSGGARFQKCAKCLTAIYCSKECQRAHWRIHKSQCAIDARNLKSPTGASAESSGADLMKLMREWTTEHRPTLARGLANAIDLYLDEHAYEKKILFMGLAHQSNAIQAGKKFKVAVAESMSIDQLLKMDGINATIAKLPEQLKIMSVEARKAGMLGTGAIVLLTRTAVHGVGTLIMPVGLSGPWVKGEDAPPPGWKVDMLEELNRD
ncbi:hypothetical protein FRB96_004379 [Tulasnella sp. 330]|nr:hypothetical protein FRB96_004379 [Tulasnella sp. 330]